MRSSISTCLAKARPSRSIVSAHNISSLLSSTRAFQTAAIPDFLLPSFQTPLRRHPQTCTSQSRLPRASHILERKTRLFSSSISRHDVNVTANPRKDEDGNPMLVDITPRAANRLKEIMHTDNNPSSALRVTVQSGGCHGFQYLMSLTSATEASPEDDTVFEASDGSGAKVIMDEPSLELLKGSKVDYTMELIGSQFKIVGNPAATSSCGCGTSFDIKM